MRMKLRYVLFVLVACSVTASAQKYILNGSVAVNASQYMWIPFYVENSAQVTGRIQAQGSINAYIVDEDGLTNLRGGATAQTYYNSGNVVVANINASLSSGSYYLVFHNKNILSAKTVFGSVVVSSNRPTSSISRCTVKRGGGTFYPEGTQRSVRLKAGTRLRYIEESGNAFVLVGYGERIGTMSGRQVVCK